MRQSGRQRVVGIGRCAALERCSAIESEPKIMKRAAEGFVSRWRATWLASVLKKSMAAWPQVLHVSQTHGINLMCSVLRRAAYLRFLSCSIARAAAPTRERAALRVMFSCSP